MRTIGRTTALGFAAAMLATPALAHTGAGAAHGFTAGLAHPLMGLDHLLAMAMVGLWAGLAGGRAAWAWPAAFVAVMVAGAGLGLGGHALPGVELAVALSVVGLGAAVALRASPPVAAGALVCGLFALFHGHAHGAELPSGLGAGGYIAGFVLATAALHGVGLGLAARLRATAWLPRALGGAVAATGLALLAA